MSNTPSADEIQQQRHIRAWTQRGGPRPSNRIRYAGPDEQYMVFGDVKNPNVGGVDPVRFWDPEARDQFRLIGQKIGSPDFPSSTVSFMRRHGGISWIAGDLPCLNNYYELIGDCGYPDNFLTGWSDGVTIYSYGRGTDRTHKGRTSQDSDDPLMDDVDHVYAAVYDIGGLSFGENATTFVEREVIDLVYGSTIQCGDCGPTDDGTNRVYMVTKSSGPASPGIPAEVIWTADGGVTFNQQNITGLGGTVDPTGIEVAGNYLIVLDTAGNGYWYAEINPLTGAPISWTNVTAGFTSNNQPNDIYVASSQEVWFCGQNGRIYKSTDIPTGVSEVNGGLATTADLIRIDGSGDTIYSVGESGVIIKSTNRGRTFATTTTSPTSGTLRALDVRDQYYVWIGSGTGGVWYTLDGGETFVQVSLSGIQVVDDIRFATDEVGYIMGRAPNSATARLWTTYASGAGGWSSSAMTLNPRIKNFLTFQRGNRVAVPRKVKQATASREIAIGGLSSGGTDGILIFGKSNVV